MTRTKKIIDLRNLISISEKITEKYRDELHPTIYSKVNFHQNGAKTYKVIIVRNQHNQVILKVEFNKDVTTIMLDKRYISESKRRHIYKILQKAL